MSRTAARPDPDDGWTRRFVAAAPRLEEVVELYESMGYEVRLEPAAARGDGPGCVPCEPGFAESKIVYTRPRP